MKNLTKYKKMGWLHAVRVSIPLIIVRKIQKYNNEIALTYSGVHQIPNHLIRDKENFSSQTSRPEKSVDGAKTRPL